MLTVLLIGLFAGAFAANGVPHFVKGITGQAHMTPFGQPSNPMTNVLWGWFNFVIAGTLWSMLEPADYETAAMAAALGSLVASAVLAYFWTKHPEKNDG